MLNSSWQVEIDDATPATWAEMLAQFNDANLYQSWSYGAIRWQSKNLSHLVLKRKGEVQGMAQIRIVRPTKLNFGMAYLRWGPICHRRSTDLDPEIVTAMARALEEEYIHKRGLLLQIVPNAFIGSPRAALFQSAFSGFTPESATPANSYRTFLVDLAPTVEELRKNLDKKWRNQLTRSEKNGLTVISGSAPEQYESFCRMYEQMLQRKGFETTVDVEEFRRIQEDLPEASRMRILICKQNGIPVAGLVVSAMGDSAIYLLGATSDEGLEAKGAYLLQWTMMQWLKQNGIRWYDLGGINPEGNPGVYLFKRGFSGADVLQMSPLAACNSVASSAVVWAGLAAQKVVRSLSALHRGRALKAT